MIKIECDNNKVEIDIQHLYSLFMEEEIFNKEVLVFISYIPFLERIYLHFPCYETYYMDLYFNNDKCITMFSNYIVNKIYDKYFEY